MMKMKLDLEDLAIETFSVLPDAGARGAGTVAGHEDTIVEASCEITCQGHTCFTCQNSHCQCIPDERSELSCMAECDPNWTQPDYFSCGPVGGC